MTVRVQLLSFDSILKTIITLPEEGPMYFDLSKGKRETVDEVLAKELLAPLLASTEPVEGFCFSNKSYTKAGAAAVAKV